MQIESKSLIDNAIDNRPFVLSCIFLICVAFGILSGFIFKSNDHDGSALAANIEVTNNDQTEEVDESTGIITIQKTSTVKVTNPQSTGGYTLTATIQQNNIPGATATIHPKDTLSSNSTSSCTESSPCQLSADTSTPLISTINSAVDGDTSVWVVTITIPAGTSTGGYLFDIAYQEDFLACSSSGGGIQSCIVDIDDGMIPIVYTGDTTAPSWAKADTSNTPSNNWYDYDAHQWANAVTVTSATLQTYKDAPAGTNIPEADIMGYWVYIPRYAYEVQRYSIQNDAIPEQTPWNIKFQKDTDPILTATPDTNPGSYTQNVGTANRWQIHPAFMTEAGQLNGIWLGKYETGDSWGFCSHDGNTNCGTTRVGNERANRARIKPDISPMTMQRPAFQYQTAVSMATHHNLGGRTSATKDSEWVSAAYLSNSRYGIYDSVNIVYFSASPAYYPETYGDTIVPGINVPSVNKVWNNGLCNESRNTGNQCTYWDTPTASGTTFLVATGYGPAICPPSQAGCAANSSAGPQEATDGFTNAVSDASSRYFTLRGMLASTTHNIYGIYDMAGGFAEYQMSVYTDTNGNPLTGNQASNNSGFLFGGIARCSAAACSNSTDTIPNENVAGIVDPWYYNPPIGDLSLGTKATSRQFDFYDRRQFIDNNAKTNYNQCDYQACGGKSTLEVMNISVLTTSSPNGWNDDSLSFVYAELPWSSRGANTLNGAAAGIWAFGSHYGTGYWDFSWRAVQSKF